MFIKLLNQTLVLLGKILAPPYCESCRVFLAERTILCATCAHKIKPLAAYDLVISKNYKVPVYAAGAYVEPLKSLILAKNRAYRLMSIYLAELIYRQTPFAELPCDLLVFVPQHWSRAWRRGYNPAQVMAQKLQTLRPGVQVADILKRTRATKYQSKLAKFARIKNVENAFSLKKIDLAKYRDQNLILIDDVCTTGATLKAIIKVLRTLQPKSIKVVVAARAN